MCPKGFDPLTESLFESRAINITTNATDAQQPRLSL